MPGEGKRQRQERLRAERLRKIEEQVAAGRLTVRQATAEERLRYGIRPLPDQEERPCR